MRCQKCRKKLSNNWHYCPVCGTDLTEQTVLVWECPKCGSWFEHDGKPHPAGILCPECRRLKYTVVGVLQPIVVYAREINK